MQEFVMTKLASNHFYVKLKLKYINNWLFRKNIKPMFISDKMCMCLLNVRNSRVLFAQWSAALLSSGNSFPFHQLRHKAAWSSHFSDHTFCPVCWGSDMSGSFVPLNTTYNIPRRVDTGLILLPAMSKYLDKHNLDMYVCIFTYKISHSNVV